MSYISLSDDCHVEICKAKASSTGSFCQIYRVTDEALIAKTAVWPNFFFMNVFFALKGSKLLIIISNGRKTDRIVSMHVEKRGYPTRLQGCFHNQPRQTERKSSNLWQPQRYLSLINCWGDTGKISIEPPEFASWSFSYQLLERYWQNFYWTAWMCILIRLDLRGVFQKYAERYHRNFAIAAGILIFILGMLTIRLLDTGNLRIFI